MDIASIQLTEAEASFDSRVWITAWSYMKALLLGSQHLSTEFIKFTSMLVRKAQCWAHVKNRLTRPARGILS